MKFIKKFNESNDFLENLQDFCEGHLVYLMDEGFDVNLGSIIQYSSRCTKIVLEKRSGFTWDEVSDRFLPFVDMLNKQYKILEIVFYQKGPNGKQQQLDSNQDIIELLQGDMDQYLENNFYFMIRILVKNPL